METRASYIAVGTFVLTVAIGLIAFVMWISRTNFDEEKTLYAIYFEGSVSGLRENEIVTYSGVPVGSVQMISIDPENIGQVRVIVSIQDPNIIRTDTIATLEVKGITGLAQIQIRGSNPNKPPLIAKPGAPYPVIKSMKSRFQQLLDSAPEVSQRVIDLVEQLIPFFSDENQKAFSKVLDNVSKFTTTLAKNEGGVTDFRNAMKGITAVSDDAEKTLGELYKLIDENRPKINQFTSKGLREFSLLISELKELAGSAHRISEDFERSPTRLLLDTKDHGKAIARD